jgi:hypothetical protein
MATHTRQRKKLLLAMADEQIAKLLQHQNLKALPPPGTVELLTTPKKQPRRRKMALVPS